MPFFYLKNSKSAPRVIIDISNGSVAGAVLRFESDKRPKIEFVSRLSLPVRSRIDSQTLQNDTESSLKKVAEDIRKHIKTSVERIDVVCSSPWFNAHTRNVSLKRNESFTVTEKLIREITDKEVEAIKRGPETDALAIEERIAHIRLNGYESQKPLEKKVNQIDLLLFVSFIPKIFGNMVVNSLEHALSAKKVVFHSLPLVCFHALSRVWHNERQFGFLHIGAELSEFLLVDNGAIAETLSFPLGTNHLIRAISEKQDVARELAQTLFSSFSRGTAEGPQIKNIEPVLAPLKEEWLAYVDEIIRNSLPEHGSLAKLYVSADIDALSFWLSTISSKVNTVLPLTAETLETFVEHPPSFQPDLFILIESLYVDAVETHHLQLNKN